MNPHTTILLWGPILIVMAIDFVFLRFRYRKPAAIERIVKLKNGTKLDFALWLVFYCAVPALGTILIWTTIPGLFLLAAIYLARVFGLKGLFGDVLPNSGFLAVVLWLFTQDLARYASHILLHKIPALWTFHKIHHATEEFNVITGNRLSLAESFFHTIVEFLLLGVVIGVPAPYVVLWVLFVRNTLNLLQHSDLPWDYGIVGYLIVSPRFHRVHHSSHEIDADTNFGTIFSCWDYLFGTLSPSYRLSPAAADTCTLGLSDKVETRDINENWLISAVNGTGLDYALKAFAWLRPARFFR
jgi:sterol desaturase/sphingolipid hydroxylase (fatty acid hydroxylase superfamily)